MIEWRNNYLYTRGEIIFLVAPPEDGGYIAKALTHAIFTQAETLDELRVNIKDAVHCHFDDGITRKIHQSLIS